MKPEAISVFVAGNICYRFMSAGALSIKSGSENERIAFVIVVGIR